MPNGGKRAFAGRKKGSVQLIKKELREILIAEFGPEKILKLFDKMYSMAMSGNTPMMKYLVDQLYGKSVESIKFSGTMENTINVNINKAKDSLQSKIIKIQNAKSIEDDKH